jgi:transcriptional regulator with XRE-family HTH domain
MEKATIQGRLARAVRARREAMHISQESFADSIGMHRAYYSSLERGQRNITIQTLARVAEGLQITIAALAKEAAI